MINMDQYLKIRSLLEEWAQLCQLYTTVQMPGQMVVNVMGSCRPEFYDSALEGAKTVLKEKAEQIKADLNQLDFDIHQLPAMRDRVK